MMAENKTRTILIFTILALALVSICSFILPEKTANAAPLTVNSHSVREYDDLNFYPGAPGNGRNGSFETPAISGNDQEIDTSSAAPWLTRGAGTGPNETKMHLIRQVSPSITTSRGSQFTAINATTRGVLYQDITVKPGLPYYILFRHHGGDSNTSDQMMFYFRGKGSTGTGNVADAAARTGWVDHAYKKTPASSNYEIAFETINQVSNQQIWMGNYIDDVQVLTPSFLDVNLSVKQETYDSGSGTPTRYRDRYVTYVLEVNNTGELGARRARVQLPLVDGIDWLTGCTVTNMNTGADVRATKTGNVVNFSIGDNANDNGGTIPAKNTTSYRYEIKARVTGTETGSSTYLQPGTLVRNQIMVTYEDNIDDLKEGQRASTYTNYSKSNALAEFIYQECGVSGYVFMDNKVDGYFVPADQDRKFDFLNAEIQIYHAGTTNIVRDADNLPVRLSMENTALGGNFRIYGLLPGRYDILLTETVGYISTLRPDNNAQNSNKSLQQDGRRGYVIAGVNISGTGSAPLFMDYQNFGLRDNLSGRTDVKYYVNMGSPETGGSDPTMQMVGNTARYTLDYGVPTRIDYTVYRNGPVIDSSVPVRVSILLTAGSRPEVYYPSGATVETVEDGIYRVTWLLNGFSLTSQRFSVVFRPYERPLEILTMRPYHGVANVSSTNSFEVMISDGRYGTNISKTLLAEGNNPAYADKDEDFTYKIDYRVREGMDIEYTFFAKVKIPKGQSSNIIYLNNLKGGHYTVTELDSNWQYSIAVASEKEQAGPIGPIYEGNSGMSYNFRNRLTNDKWVNGNANVENKMAQP